MELKSIQRELGVPGKSSLYKQTLVFIAQITILVVLSVSLSFPGQAHAGIFSKMADFFSGDAKADVIDDGQNSQTAPVLEAKIAMSDTQKAEIPVKMTEDNVLVPEVGTLGTALDVEDYVEDDTITVYITKAGDTLSKIAEMHKVSVNTIVWANDGLDPKKPLKEGTSLLIMPITGVSHTIKKGDTLNAIAKKYGADITEVARFNGVTDETLVVGETIIVPNGEIAAVKVAPKSKKVSVGISGITGGNGNSYYRRPVWCPVTQGIHGYNSVDLGCPVGTPIAAAAAGRVIFTNGGGWGGGYGIYAIVAHSNGTQTLYAHMSRLAVSTGQSVSDGQIIGYTGNTGRSTGPHLHFEIRGTPGITNCVVRNVCR